MKALISSSTCLLMSSVNKKFGTAFCVYRDNKGSYLLTSAYTVEECGKDNLLIQDKTVILLHCGSRDTIDLAILFIENIKIKVLNLIDVKMNDNTLFEVNGFSPHINQNYKLESLNGVVNKYSKLYSKDNEIDRYELTIDLDDKIGQGYSGSAIICLKTKYVFYVTTMSTNGNNTEAIPIKYVKNIWVDAPKRFLKSITKNTNSYNKLIVIKKEWWFSKIIKYFFKKIFNVIKYVMIFITIVILFVLIIVFQDVNKAEELNKKGEEAYQLQDIEGAISYYNQAIILTRQDVYSIPIVFANLAEAYYDIGNYIQATSEAQTAIRLASNTEKGLKQDMYHKAEGKAYYILGRIKEYENKLDDALANYKIALKKKNEVLYESAINRIEEKLLK